MFTKKTVAAILSVFTLVIVSGCDSSVFTQGKVGYINLERLVKESEMGKAAMADIEALRQEKQAMISQLTKEISDIQE
ncbi:MAG: OmpH family outer membrane protein [Proteobacteria bacterium]|nr:OmpH family outer membrane protein [Pseudomonadota bacterium]MBU1389913.1 OmpH family outer membrane protein [Pseudomonadota bacterium]MBU1543922.1 OmpH family outer membrane protein [Pseudomonadota bacterium]MBU2481973.1 OmpH family outer membrane protein [Pseudomonadota bacterium]